MAHDKQTPKFIIADVAADLSITTVYYSGSDKDAAQTAFEKNVNSKAIHGSKAAGFKRKTPKV